MEGLSTWFSWTKERHGRISLDPEGHRDQERDANEQLLQSAEHIQQEKDVNSRCWRLLRWPYNVIGCSKRSEDSSCVTRRKTTHSSKIHPLSSRLIRARNHMSGRDSPADLTPPVNRNRTTGIACLRYPEPHCLSLSPRETEERCPESANSNSSANLLSCKESMGEGEQQDKPQPPHDDLRSVLTTQTSWKWFYSSELTLDKFLQEACSLKQRHKKEGVELGEYRTLLLKGNLSHNRLRRYPKPVLRFFVYLLRDQEAPTGARKKALIDFCVNWHCKKRNYWCSCEQLQSILSSLSPAGKSSEGQRQEIDAEYVTYNQKQSKRVLEIDSSSVTQENSTRLILSPGFYADEKERQDEEEMEPLVGNMEGDNEDEYEDDEATDAKSERTSLNPTACSCSVCSSHAQFCHGCMCFTCMSVIRPGEEWKLIKCGHCAHLCHLKCALKLSMAGFVAEKGLDGEFLCQCCRWRQDLEEFWMDRLHKASRSDDVHVVEKNLYSAMVAFKDTRRERFKDAQTLVGEAWSQIVNGGRVAEVQSLVRLICDELQDGNGCGTESDMNVDGLKAVEERANQCAKKAEEDQVQCAEVLQEVEAWKGILQQAQLQLQKLQMKLTSKKQFALLSRSAAIIAQKRSMFYSKRLLLCSAKPMCQTDLS